MKILSTFILIFLISPLYFNSAFAKAEKEAYIESASQFQRWCKRLSYRHFRKQKQQPYNWSASTIRQLNDYQTTGSWRVKNENIDVICLIRIGKKAKHAILEIH